MFPAVGDCFSFRIVAHEFGHALGLRHDHREPNLMSGSTGYLSRLSECAVHFLAVHPIFNPSQVNSNTSPTLQRLFPVTLPSKATYIRFIATHAAALHQVQLFTDATPADPLPGLKLLACQPLNGKKTAFQFAITGLTATPTDAISLRLTDVHGNTSWARFPNAIDGTVQLDLNGDGVLDISDLVIIAAHFGDTETLHAADINRDGVVNVLDLVLVAGYLDPAATPR